MQMDILNYKFEGHQITSFLKDGEPWFLAKDVADTLGYQNGSRDVNRHVDKEDRETHQVNVSGQRRDMIIVNESGLYALIFGSKLESAKKFKRWVTSEVLPSIRKHGAYATDDTIEKIINDPDMGIRLLQKLKEEREEKMLLEQQIAEYEPKITYLDTILSSTNTVTITQIAADYGLSGQALNKILNELHVQHKVGGQWILYRKHMQQGYTKSHTSEIPKADGGVKVVMNTKWTQKGRLFLYNLLKDEGYLPQMDLELEES